MTDSSLNELTTETLASRLRGRYGADVDPNVSLQGSECGDRESALSREVLRRLAGRTQLAFGRYSGASEVAHGGMGVVLRVWDEDLRRPMAMKVMLHRGADPDAPVDPRDLARFLEEAQVTGQLEHPGIVPVHELGLDPSGRVYFTMKLVKGRTLRELFDVVARGEGAWTQTRVLGLILRVCEAMAYAHDKRVIHRDLKPSNIMVGRFGEVYVMDWGLAKILGEADRKDIRIREDGAVTATRLSSERTEIADEDPESPLYTMDGDIVGTPAYMSPEQAAGEIEAMGPHSDVYSVGAMMYHLITGSMPYVPRGTSVSPQRIWRSVMEGPPRSIHSSTKSCPPELQAVIEKAMARRPADRYADMGELSRDLLAYLEHRVVRAYESGVVAEFKKLVRRNRATASVVLVALLVLFGGALATTLVLAGKNRALSVATDEAQAKKEEVLSLSAMQDLSDLVQRAGLLWPPVPDRIRDYEAWIANARLLTADYQRYADKLAELRERAVAPTPEQVARDRGEHPRAAELARELGRLEDERRRLVHLSRTIERPETAAEVDALRAAIAAHEEVVADLETEVEAPWRWRFAERDDQWWHDNLQQLVGDMDLLIDPIAGALAGSSTRFGMGISHRLDLARELEQLSSPGSEVASAWEAAVCSIADPVECSQYAGLRITPQPGLAPLGRDPETGLWEFAYVLTGAVPARDPGSGRLAIGPDVAVVLVLVPGGEFLMGAQAVDENAPNYDPEARADEQPLRTVRVSPFFMSKYELTQRQWERFAGINPSRFPEGAVVGGETIVGHNPVESITWEDCVRVLGWMGLALPTEAQWEYAARGGTTTPWSTGVERTSLYGFANIADRSGMRARTTWLEKVQAFDHDDGHAVHAPIGTYRPNPFGLHDVHGNVWEWCRDGKATYLEYATDGDVEPFTAAGDEYCIRGGASYFPTRYARSSRRFGNVPGFQLPYLGVRPMLALRD